MTFLFKASVLFSVTIMGLAAYRGLQTTDVADLQWHSLVGWTVAIIWAVIAFINESINHQRMHEIMDGIARTLKKASEMENKN